ncbi:MAG: DUF4012 domain-containing protein [Candidatus Nanopelagicales bacterium]|nr:DUF4012 domain-containing protein [Candidatus Nanopelagicales bacterium]
MATALTLVGYLLLTGGLAAGQLTEAKDRAAQIGQAADRPDARLGELVDELGALRVNLIRADNYTSGPAWWLASRVPVVGPGVDAVRRTTSSAGELARAAAGLEEAVRALVTSGDGTFGKAIPRPVLTRLGEAAGELVEALEYTEQQIEGIDASALPAGLGETVARAQGEIASLAPELAGLARAAGAIAKLLGSERAQRWFVAIQNGGEARGTGGLVGAFALMKVDAGAVKLERTGANEELTELADAGLLPLDSQNLWGAARLQHIYGVNLSPHFPYAGELLASMWKRQTKELPDAVMSLDQRAVANLIGVVGPVTVDGITVTGENAYQWLTVEAYRRFPESAAKDAFVLKLTAAVLDRLASGSAPALPTIRALFDSIRQRNLYLWAAEPGLEAQLAEAVIGGTVPDQPGPFAMAVVNNNAGNKLDSFLYTNVRYRGGECVGSGRRSVMTVELRNDAPLGLPDSYFGRGDRAMWGGGDSRSDGSNRVRLAVYLPQGAHLATGGTGVPGADAPLFTGEERGHPVAMFGVELPPKGTRTIEVEFTEFGTLDLLNAPPIVQPQPMLNPQGISVEKGPDCT